MQVFTSRYADYRPDWGVAVRTSVGSPRGWRYGPLVNLRSVAPYGLRHVTERAEFTALYLARLELTGPDAIHSQLREISDSRDGRPPILCCFEDVRKPGVWCHRQLLGEWLHARLGIDVVELSGSSSAAQLKLLQ